MRVIGPQGRPVEALQRQDTLDRIDGPMRLRGMYFYLADAASLQECLSGRRWPVLIDGAHLDLERAYLAQGEGGRWVLATLEGRFVMHDGEGNRVRGFGGCNALSGRVEQGSDGFLVKALALTRRCCAGAVGAQDASYLAALQATASRQIVGDALRLRDAQGRMRLRFEALYLR